LHELIIFFIMPIERRRIKTRATAYGFPNRQKSHSEAGNPGPEWRCSNPII